MKNGNFKENLWKYVLPILALVLWISTAVLWVKCSHGYTTDDYEAQMEIMNAKQWYPACFIGAIISTVAAYVVSELSDRIGK